MGHLEGPCPANYITQLSTRSGLLPSATRGSASRRSGARPPSSLFMDTGGRPLEEYPEDPVKEGRTPADSWFDTLEIP